MPVDAPTVYTVDKKANVMEGGTSNDLVKQILTVLKDKLDFEEKDMHYIRGTYISLLQYTMF